MVYFLIKKLFRSTVDMYLANWAPDMAEIIQVISYEDLAQTGKLTPGTYIFCDQERWSSRQKNLAIELRDQLAGAGPGFVILNDPRRVLLRFELLRLLHAIGQNAFNVYRLPEAMFRTVRFPVFLHTTNRHEGARSPVLSNRAALLFWSCRKPYRWGETIVEEFCDVSVDGFFTKYGAFNMAGAIVPKHYFLGKNWCLKDTEILGEKEEKHYIEYLRDNPHEKKLQELFKLAQIDYGRMDYAFLGDRLQVWEINTNPILLSPRHKFLEKEVQFGETFDVTVKPHLRRMAAMHQEGEPLAYRLSGRF